MNTSSITKAVIAITILILVGAAAAWYFLLRPATPTAPTGQIVAGSFGTDTVANTGGSAGSTPEPQTNTPQISPEQKLFKITSGPVAGAIYLQTKNPTTTIARYVMADNGHVLEVPVSIANATPQAVSNTTIPGIASALWAGEGKIALLQYLDVNTLKTVSIEFAARNASSSSPAPAKIQFLRDNILSLAASPDGKSVAYLLEGGSGADGYVAATDGTGAKKLFSLQLLHTLLSWPSQALLLAQTKSAAGVPGIALSINAKTGATAQLVYAPGLSVLANNSFSKILYQTVSGANGSRITYSRDSATGKNVALSYQPFPEKCVWSPVREEIVFCATPTSYVPANYLDLWHQGTASSYDSILAFNVATGKSSLLVTPGDRAGGVKADIAQLSISADGNYLLYITKGDRSLWGVNLPVLTGQTGITQ